MSVPDPYAEERAFLATLPGWRRFLARLNWHPPPLNDDLPSQDSVHPQTFSARNAVKATLLLLLGTGLFVFLAWSQYLLIALLLIPVFLISAALISALWRAIDDTLQEGEIKRNKRRNLQPERHMGFNLRGPAARLSGRLGLRNRAALPPGLPAAPAAGPGCGRRCLRSVGHSDG
jgi:hypothetical protein